MNLSKLEQYLIENTHGLRVALLGALAALLIIFACRASADEALTSATAIPSDAPLTVVLVESCQRTPLALFATMADGTLLMFDRHSGNIDLEALSAWGLRAKHTVTAAIPCGGQST